MVRAGKTYLRSFKVGWTLGLALTEWNREGSGKVVVEGEAGLTDQKLPGDRFPLSVVSHAQGGSTTDMP